MFILGVQAVQTDSGGNIGGILILGFQAFLHVGQVNQVQHTAPVNALLCANLLGGIFNSFLYHLKLFNTVTDEFLLHFQ